MCTHAHTPTTIHPSVTCTLMYTYMYKCRDMCSPVVCCSFEASVTEDEVEVNSPAPLTSVFVKGGGGGGRREEVMVGREMKCHKQEIEYTNTIIHVQNVEITCM